MVGAQSGDAVGGERVAGAGAPSLAGEDRGDLLVGVALGELAHERDRVLVGAARVAAGAWQGHGVLGDLAPPSHTTRSSALCCSESRSTVTTTSVRIARSSCLRSRSAGGGRVEHLAQVRARAAAPRDLLVGQRAAGVWRRPRPARARRARTSAEPLLPLALQRARDEPVLGLAGVELAPGALGVDLRAARARARPSGPAPGDLGGVLDRAQRGLDPRRASAWKTASSTTRSIRRPPTDWQRSVP